MEYNKVFYGEAYCVKCKDKVTFEGQILVSDSGRRMAQGKCPQCSGRVNRILGASPNAPKPALVTPQPAVVPTPEPYAVITMEFADGWWTAHVADKHQGVRRFKNFTRKRAIRKAMQWINSYQVIKLTEGRR